MRTHGIHDPLLALLLAAPLTASAVTDIWDGGGFNDLIITSANWVDNTAPLSDIDDTDLIFSGVIRLTPIFSAPFSAHSVTFSNTAGAFAIQGVQLNVGNGGIVNADTQTMTFVNPVSFSTANFFPAINAFAGDLHFANTVTLPPNTLDIFGVHDTSFENFSGTSGFDKYDSGTMTWTPSVPAAFDVRVLGGTLAMGADGSTDVFNSTASIDVLLTSTFNINENLTLNGAELTRDFNATINLAAGKTLTVQNGGDVSISGNYPISTASTTVVTGAGSTFSCTSQLLLSGGSTMNILAGADLFIGSAQVSIGDAGGNGTMTVDGSGSSLLANPLRVGFAGGAGILTFSNGSTGTINGMYIDDSMSPGTNGIVNIQSGATVTTSALEIAPNAAANHGAVTITGAGSELTVSGSTVIGAASASNGELNVEDGGAFTSGDAPTTVNATGTIAIAGGTYLSLGDLAIDGGELTRDASGQLLFDMGKTLTVQAGGDVNITGAFSSNFLSNFLVTGSGSTLSVNGNFTMMNSSELIAEAGGSVSVTGGQTNIGSGPSSGMVSVTGAGSSFTGGTLVIVGGFNTGMTFTNGSTGTFSVITIDATPNPGFSGMLSIQSGSTVSAIGLSIAPLAAANTGTVTVDGFGSTLTVTGGAPITIGAASANTGTLQVQNGGVYHSGTGLTTVNATGEIAITGGTYHSNGSLTLNGGELTRDATGVFNLAAGQTFTVQAGGDALFLGNLSISTASNIVLIGPGTTTLTTTGILSLNGGSNVTVSTGADLSSGTAQVNIGTASNGTVTVNGIGSSFSGGPLAIAQGGNTGGLTFSNNATGSFTNIFVDPSAVAETSGMLNIQSGANVTGSSLTISPSAAPNTGTVTINGTGSLLTISGSSAIGAASTNSGTLNVQSSGTFNGGTTTLNPTGTININGGTVNLNGPLVRNGGTLNFVTGALNIVDDFTVGAGGLLGTNVTLDTTRQFTTTGAATIDAPATLTFHGGTFSSGALTNNGQLDFSNSNTNLHGDVMINPGSHVSISGAGSTTTFFDDVIHNGAEILVGAGASAVFANNQSGTGPFTGLGTVTFNGVHRPGTSQALVTFGGNVIYGSSATIELELGGTVRGTDYDALDVNGHLTLDGRINVVLVDGFEPQAGTVFNLFDWGAVSGAFDLINLPKINSGLGWDTSQLFTNGTLSVVVPEPTCATLLIVAAGGLLTRLRLRRQPH
jgi:T5SS/PEP-CTERM-associated repeat protein